MPAAPGVVCVTEIGGGSSNGSSDDFNRGHGGRRTKRRTGAAKPAGRSHKHECWQLRRSGAAEGTGPAPRGEERRGVFGTGPVTGGPGCAPPVRKPVGTCQR